MVRPAQKPQQRFIDLIKPRGWNQGKSEHREQEYF